MKKHVFLFPLLCILFCATATAGEVYQYTTQKGVLTLSDKPIHYDSRKPPFTTVKQVFDGDTFVSEGGVKYRLLGIDTPETAKQNNPGDYYGDEAKEELKRLIAGKRVFLKYDKTLQDDYGRFLVFVTTDEGIFVNELLLKNGFARTFVIPPNLEKINEFRRLEDKARLGEKGLWQNIEEREVISTSEAWKYQGKVKFVRGRVSKIEKKKKGAELVFDDGKFVAFVYNKNIRYFNPIEQYIGGVITIKGKIKRKVKNATTVLFHPIQLY